MGQLPIREQQLRQSELEATSIYGSPSWLLDSQSFDEARARLPASTVHIEIEGANPAYFGDYGAQEDDAAPTISREQARAEIVRASSDLI